MHFQRLNGGLNFNITLSCITRQIESRYAMPAQSEGTINSTGHKTRFFVSKLTGRDLKKLRIDL